MYVYWCECMLKNYFCILNLRGEFIMVKDDKTIYDTDINGIKERIREYQKNAKGPDGKRLKDKDVVNALDEELLNGNSKKPSDKTRLNFYKNLKGEYSNVNTISRDLLNALAMLFGCPPSALEKGITHNEAGDKLINPIHDVDAQKRMELYHALENDRDSVEKLHFLFCELPEDDSKHIINGIMSYLAQLSNNSYYSTSIQSTSSPDTYGQKLSI